MHQLDFFHEPLSELELLKNQMTKVEESFHCVRRGVFKRHSNLEKLYVDLRIRLDEVEYDNRKLLKENDQLQDKLSHIDKLVVQLKNYIANMETIA
jgi:predicted nuclease with TOPRIM domain